MVVARRLHGAITVVLLLSALLCFTPTGVAGPIPQNQPAQPAPKPSDILHPALNQVSQTVVALNISRWKAPSEVRAATQQNVDSIQRDLNSTLPGLLATADAAPASVSAVFPVYRNIDALYDVLLRVSQTAVLAAPENDAGSITNALSRLESARGELGNAILGASKNAEDESVKLRTALQQAIAAKAAEPPKTTIVDDGPVKTTSSSKHKKKPASTSTGSQPAAKPQN